MFYLVKGSEIVGKEVSVFPVHPDFEFIESELDMPTNEVVVAGGVITPKPIEEKSYFELRREAYPRIQDQLDSIFHNGIDVWKAEIQVIKDRFPKPLEADKPEEV